MKSSNTYRTRIAALLTAALFFCAVRIAFALPAPPTVALESLEPRIDDAPGILADVLDVEAAIHNVDAEKDKLGLQYTVNETFGPRAIIVPRSVDYHVLRFEQNYGLQLPLFGSNLQEQVAVLDAQQQQEVAAIALAQARRERLSALRQAYVEYWSYGGQGGIAEGFLSTAQRSLTTARSLENAGFWTYTQYLDLLTAIDQIRSSAQNYRSTQIAQLAQIQEALGTRITPFEPQEPRYFVACTPSRDAAETSAFSSDATLAEYDAQIAVILDEAKHVKNSSIQGAANLTAGSVTDVNYRVSGYDLIASISLTAPKFGRAEERNARSEYEAKVRALGLDEIERRNEIGAALDSDLQNVTNAKTTLAQAYSNLSTSRVNLQKAIVRYTTLHQGGGVGFTDVQARSAEVYTAEIAVQTARAELLTQANALLLLAPAACR